MAVDKLRGTHHVNWTAPSDIGLLLSAQSYRPEITQAIRKVKSFSWKPLQELVENTISPGVHPNYGGTYPCLKTKNVQDLLVDEECSDFADVSQLTELDKYTVKYADLIMNLTGSGSIGRVSVYYGNDKPITNQHITRMTLKAGYDEGYIAAYLRSWWGERSLEQGIAGSTGQINMVNDHVRSIPIPLIDLLARKYIGDKVRQAERLRSWAKNLRLKTDNFLNSMNLPVYTKPQMLSYVSTERLEDRLDPRPYRTHYLSLVDSIRNIKNSSISEIAYLSSGCPVSSNDFIENGEIPLVRIRNIGVNSFIDLDTGVNNEVYHDQTRYHAKEKMIVLGMDGIFRAQFFVGDDLPMLVNQRVAIIECHNIRAELLTHWLNRPEGQMQLNQWAVKTTVEHTSLSDIGRVCIPRLDHDMENNLADYLLSARKAYIDSKTLTVAAKLLVEGLIEGLVTEAELIAAQQGLEAGDTEADAAILRRLRTDGLDGKGQPLFGDVERVYELLVQANLERE